MDSELLEAFERLMEAQGEYRFAERRQKTIEALDELDEEWEEDWLVLEEEWVA